MSKFWQFALMGCGLWQIFACRGDVFSRAMGEAELEKRLLDSVLLLADAGGDLSYRIAVRQELVKTSDGAMYVIWRPSERVEGQEFSCKDLLGDKNSRRTPVDFTDTNGLFQFRTAIAKTIFDRCDFQAAGELAKFPQECLVQTKSHNVVANRVDSCLIHEVSGQQTVVAQSSAQPMAMEMINKDPSRASFLSLAERNRRFDPAAVDDIIAYGEMCARDLGPIPAFSCLDGVEIGIVKNGEVQTQDSQSCDNPSYLQTFGGECRVGSRIGRLKSPNPNVHTVFICRRSEAARAVDDANFQDIGVIQHDLLSGKTCWYQALAVDQPGGQALNGRRVPPPTEVEVPLDWRAQLMPTTKYSTNDDFPNARSFWLRPSRTAEIRCVRCHDSDPFVSTPYITEVTEPLAQRARSNILPCNPRLSGKGGSIECSHTNLSGNYSHLGSFMKEWPTPYAISPRANRLCVSCHRIGSLGTREYWASDSVGEELQQMQVRTNLSLAFPVNHWMIPQHGKRSKIDWDKAYGKHWQALKFCIDHWFQKGGPSGQSAAFNENCSAATIISVPGN